MGRKYSEEFKKKALSLRDEVLLKGFVKVGKITINNINELCDYLDIVKSTLYEWVKERKRYEGLLEKRIAKKEMAKERERKEIKEIVFDKEIEELFEKGEAKQELRIKSELRWYGVIAGTLGIKNYSHMNPNQLKFSIGLKLMKESGLIEIPNINGKKKREVK